MVFAQENRLKNLTMKRLLLISIFLSVLIPVFSNNNDTIPKQSLVYEKLYLHVDRELYTPGDVLWFKSYLVSGINNKFIPGYKNLYVQLISENGEIVDNKLLLSRDGSADGYFDLDKEIKQGKYIVQAHTKYQKNFGEESYFHKEILVADSNNETNIAEQDSLASLIDISFLPEGGSLILNAINYVAFKATDGTGKGKSVSGKIIDEAGDEVVSFQSKYKGMGKFMMMPQEDKSYFAILDEYPNEKFELVKAKPQGISLNYKPDGNYLLFTLSRNLKTTTAQDFVLKATHKGIDLFNSEFTMNEFQHAQRLFKGLFPLGISKVSLYDLNGKIVAERMVFVRNNSEQTVQVSVDKQDYTNREKVELDLAPLLSEGDSLLRGFSVAVVHEDYFGSDGNTQNIESYLLLDSELKGSIETPAFCFVNENNISADEKLDLVMMVNGWRNYIWNDLENFRGKSLSNWADYGLTLNGKLDRHWGKKPVDFGEVVLGPFSSGFLFEKTKTDETGNFSFEKLYLKDSATVMINATTKNGSRRVNVKLQSQWEIEPLADKNQVFFNTSKLSVPLKFYRAHLNRKSAENDYYNQFDGILLDDVFVKGSKVTGDGHFRLYGEPDVSLEITDEDQHFFSVLDYLEHKSIPGVIVTGESVLIRNSQSNPLLLVDGIDTDWTDIVNVPIGDVDKIEILKSGFGMASYGSRGGDGVIAILTKMGKGEWEATFNRIIHGRATPLIKGFQQRREFYSPKYTYLNLNDPKPDYRPTLYWNPYVHLKDGKAKVEFSTSDAFARYKVIVEGISKTGKICTGFGNFAVSIPRN